MLLKELLEKRYSCRKYREKPVKREKIQRCINAARLAPSACNAQPWEFIVIDDNQVKERVADAAASGIYRFSKFLKKAPVLIIVVADKGSFTSRAGSLVRNTNFYLIDIGIASEHLVLQATEEELGSCYVGWINDKKIKKTLGIPKKLIIPHLITLGYPQKSHKEKDPVRRRAEGGRRKDLDTIVHYNKYR